MHAGRVAEVGTPAALSSNPEYVNLSPNYYFNFFFSERIYAVPHPWDYFLDYSPDYSFDHSINYSPDYEHMFADT